MSKADEIKIIDIFMQLSFELGQAYQSIYNRLDLDNVIDFNNIALANGCGAQWNFKGDMSNLPELFKIHKSKQEGINELNKIARDLERVKLMAKEVVK